MIAFPPCQDSSAPTPCCCPPGNPAAGLMVVTTATRSGSRPGGLRNRMALTMLNMVAFMPMPNARVMTAIV